MFPVSVLAQVGDIRADFVHEYFSLTWFCHVDHLLHHIIGVLVLHHGVQCTR